MNPREIEAAGRQAQQLRDELEFPAISGEIVQSYSAPIVRRAVAAIYSQYGQALQGVACPRALLVAMCKKLRTTKPSRSHAVKAPSGCGSAAAVPLERKLYSGPLFDRNRAASEIPTSARTVLDGLFSKEGRS